MKKINLKEDHLQIYKRENSNVWQIKIKLPHKKALRISSRTKVLEDAKNIALHKYNFFIKERKNIDKNSEKNFQYKKIHLIESKNLKKNEIECFLIESNKYIKFNKQNIKKSNLLKGRTVFNLFFEDSTRTRTSFEVAAKRLGADLINVALKDSSINKGETLFDTMTTINSMDPDVLIVRHPEEGISKKISKIVLANIFGV